MAINTGQFGMQPSERSMLLLQRTLQCGLRRKGVGTQVSPVAGGAHHEARHPG